MKTFTREYRISEYRDEEWSKYFGGLNGCVFDIETTGFTPKGGRCKVILTAMLIPTEKGVKVTQFLAEDPYEEDRVIAKTMEYFKENNIDYLITYNGASFDIPFMRERIEFLHLPYELNMYNMDLYSFLKKNSILPRHLESMSQKSVEEYFGFGKERKDIITGKESVKLYFEYVTTHDSITEKIILTHNREDVVQLYRLLKAAGYMGFSNVLDNMTFDDAIARFGMPVGEAADLTAVPMLTRSKLKVRGRQRRAPKLMGDGMSSESDRPVRVYFDDSVKEFPINARIFPTSDEDMSIEFAAETHSFELLLPLVKHGESSYVDLMVLDAEDEVIDKYGIRELDGYVNGYLILINESKVNQKEINALTYLMCECAMNRISEL